MIHWKGPIQTDIDTHLRPQESGDRHRHSSFRDGHGGGGVGATAAFPLGAVGVELLSSQGGGCPSLLELVDVCFCRDQSDSCYEENLQHQVRSNGHQRLPLLRDACFCLEMTQS